MMKLKELERELMLEWIAFFKQFWNSSINTNQWNGLVVRDEAMSILLDNKYKRLKYRRKLNVAYSALAFFLISYGATSDMDAEELLKNWDAQSIGASMLSTLATTLVGLEKNGRP